MRYARWSERRWLTTVRSVLAQGRSVFQLRRCSTAVEVACGNSWEAGLGDPAEGLAPVHELVAVDQAAQPLVVSPEPTRRPFGPWIVFSTVGMRRDDRGSACPGCPERRLEPLVDRTPGAQADCECVPGLVGISGSVCQLGAGNQQQVVLLTRAPRLALERLHVMGVRLRTEAKRASVAPKQVVGYAEDVEAVHSVQVNELGDGERAVAPRRMGVQLAQEHPGFHSRRVAVPPGLLGEKAVKGRLRLGDHSRRLGRRQHRGKRALEDVPAVECVLLVELDGTVQLQDHVTTVRRREQIDADEIRVDRSRRSDGEGAGFRRGRDTFTPCSERDIRPPLAGSSDSPNGADDRAARNDDPEVVAERRDELLDDRTMRLEPAAIRVVGEAAIQGVEVLAEHDVLAPAPKARLDHDRRSERDGGVRFRHMDRAWVGHSGAFKTPRRCQFVVRGDEWFGSVQDTDARALEARELPETILDSVEPGRDVEAADRNISLRKRPKCLGRRQHLDVAAAGRERLVRWGSLMGDKRDEHGEQKCALEALLEKSASPLLNLESTCAAQPKRPVT
jgi:hypothetical protein